MRPSPEALKLDLPEAPPAARTCAHPGCRATGDYPAPRSLQSLREYVWFCLDHVRDYNARWNYCEGLTPEEIEKVVRFDTIWNRETRPMRDWSARTSRLWQTAERLRTGAEAPPAPPGPGGEVGAALTLFGLKLPFSVNLLRQRYRELVKRHHPDTNGGSREAEEKFKDINRAFHTLRRFLTGG